MTRKLSLVLILLLVWLAFTHLIYAQTSTPPASREALLQAIEERAQRDVELGKAQQSITELDALFGVEAQTVGLPLREALLIYEEAYAAAKPVEPWWASLRPNVGWIVAAIFFVLFILRDILTENLTRFFKWLIEALYNRLAGYKPFWWIALRRYRRELVNKYREIKIPFRPNRPLKMEEIYVPLKVSGSGDLNLIDAYQAVAQHRRLMITGKPGAGKSMLLRNIVLTYAQGELGHFADQQPVPVLFELHRLNEPQLSLRDQLTQVLERNDFPNADRFVTAGLEHGLLLLLFDGLDEVSSQRRPQVVMQIKDLLEQHPGCRALVTCRTMVYKREFDEWAGQTLEIAEFSDQQIQQFLNPWQADLPADKSITHLLHNLRERPRIMALARNPLLLTIIAYLYADTAFVLPHSRAEFYDKATDILLDQWKGERNQYKVAHKQLVLQHLALFNQNSAAQRTEDPLSVDLSTVLEQIKHTLPRLNLPDNSAEPLLDEIVERSGLLISIDGGQKYQFPHLTLQEFFAARALEGEGQSEALFDRFSADPDAWRETVKLWCGLKQNSSVLIEKIYARDPVTALGALGEALQVDDQVANKIIAAFTARLGEDGNTGEAVMVMRALAAVAVDSGPRGRQLFDFLTGKLADDDSHRRQAAAETLALTNLPQAARALAARVHDWPDLRRPLTQMGNLAVPPLTQWAKEGQIWALDDLQLIGTPLAAQTLAGLLWNSDQLAYQSAWRLAALLSKPGVEPALRELPLSPEQRRAAALDWVWEPFEPDTNAPLRVIAGRVAYLLHTAPPETVPPDPPPHLDSRLVIPLCAVAAQKSAGKFTPLDKKELQELEARSKNELNEFPAEILNKISTDRGWRYLFGGLYPPTQLELLHRLMPNKPVPTSADWRNIFRPVAYEFKDSWEAAGIKLALAIFLLPGLWSLGSVIWQAPQLLSWDNGVAVVMMIGLIALLKEARQIQLTLDDDDVYNMAFWGFCSIGPFAGLIVGVITDNRLYGAFVGVLFAVLFAVLFGALSGALFGALSGARGIRGGIFGGIRGGIFGGIVGGIFGVVFGVSSFFIAEILVTIYVPIARNLGFAVIVTSAGAIINAPTLLLFNYWGWSGVIVFWLGWLAWVVLLWRSGAHRQRAAQNPLRGLLESGPGVAVMARRRWWLWGRQRMGNE